MMTNGLAILSLLCFLLCLLPALSHVDGLTCEGTLVIPGLEKKVSNIRVVLNGGEYTSLSRQDGSFAFYNVDTGIYLLEVMSVEFAFPQMKVKVDKDKDGGTINVVEYKYPGANRTPATHPIRLVALTPLKYFQDPPRFSILGFIMGNPMILLMGLSGGLMFLFPKMLQNMDPEAMKQFEEAQNQEDPMAAIKKMMSMGSEE